MRVCSISEEHFQQEQGYAIIARNIISIGEEHYHITDMLHAGTANSR